MPEVLVIDDSPLVHHCFQRDFEDSGVSILTAATARDGLAAVAEHRPDVVILDVVLPDFSGLEAFQRIRDLDLRIPVIIITAGTESSTAIEAMKLGAYDYLLKPLDSDKVRQLVFRAIEIRQLMTIPVDLAEQKKLDTGPRDVLVGRCPQMQEVYKAIGRVASQDITVLIHGESGTGKELVARAIYQHGSRAKAPFLAINCPAIPESLLESELLGHEKGAFTGADDRRIGKFEQFSGGTLFLDEIGTMSPATQTKILRLLQEQTFERVGGAETIHTDVRIIAATNRNLKQAVAEDSFRSDLYYRLNVFTITLPPLRERTGDLPLLIEHFLTEYRREMDKEVRDISPIALELLSAYQWPGNVRELQSAIKQAILHSTGFLLLPEFLPQSITNTKATSVVEQLSSGEGDSDWRQFINGRMAEGSTDLYLESLAKMDRELLTTVLRHTGGNQLQTAKILGISRGTLRNKLRSYDITIARTIGEDEEES